jgi:outer membrane receptor for Fe3+-dicitrate
MKKKKVSKVAQGMMAKVVVLRGSKAKTTGGLTAKDLTKTKFGRVVSKKQSANGKKQFGAWHQAVAKARKALQITGFSILKKGTPLYTKAKELYGR